MANLRNRVDMKIVRSWETDKILFLVGSPSFARYDIFGNDLAGRRIHMHKSKPLLNKSVYTGMTILENSKILMYGFFHDYLKAKSGTKCKLIFTDTNSLVLDIQTFLAARTTRYTACVRIRFHCRPLIQSVGYHDGVHALAYGHKDIKN